MSSGPGHRPGGLTALAVLNFIFGGVGALVVLVSFLGIKLAEKFRDTGDVGVPLDAATRQNMQLIVDNLALVYLSVLLMAISCFLLITSGVGYLKQKRFLGKTLGTVYGIMSLIGTGIGIYTSKEFGIANIIGLLYPILTILLLNTAFKDDFPNP